MVLRKLIMRVLGRYMNGFMIVDDEECPCGSGKLYEKCCKGREGSPILSKKPIEVLVMERMKASIKKCCMHPAQEDCRGKIKNAHALQNNKIISILAGTSRHVYMLNSKRQPIVITLENGEIISLVEVAKTSANDATTEPCFCDVHDNVAFAIIEKGAPDFDETREDMKFVYAYKAFIFECYKQWIELDVFWESFKENPAISQAADVVHVYRMLQLKQQEFEPIKKYFDSQIIAGTYDGITTCVVKIPFQIHFADYAYIALNCDLNGKKIEHTRNGIMHRLAITVFPETTQSWLLLSCLDSERDLYAELFEQLKVASIDKMKFYFNMMLPLYSENMVISEALWEGWNEEVKMAYTYLANLQGPDFVKMENVFRSGIAKAAKDELGMAYKQVPKINMFLLND